MNSEIETLRLRLCLAVGPCPEVTRGIEFAGPEFLNSHPLSCICGGTGKVPLLEGVREKCRAIIGGHEVNCEVCQGRGWVPTTDLWKWFEAGQKCFAQESMAKQWLDWQEMKRKVHKGALVFFQAFAKHLGVKE